MILISSRVLSVNLSVVVVCVEVYMSSCTNLSFNEHFPRRTFEISVTNLSRVIFSCCTFTRKPGCCVFVFDTVPVPLVLQDDRWQPLINAQDPVSQQDARKEVRN